MNTVEQRGFTPLHIAAQRGFGNVLEVLLTHALRFDIVAIDGTTVLHTAAQHGHAAIARELVLHSANVDTTKAGCLHTPLHVATESSQYNVVEQLLVLGATVDARIVTGEMALAIAASYGQVAIVEVLLQHGADVYATTPAAPHSFLPRCVKRPRRHRATAASARCRCVCNGVVWDNRAPWRSSEQRQRWCGCAARSWRRR